MPAFHVNDTFVSHLPILKPHMKHIDQSLVFFF